MKCSPPVLLLAFACLAAPVLAQEAPRLERLEGSALDPLPPPPCDDPELERLLRESDPLIGRIRAVQAMQRMGPKAAAARTTLEVLASSGDTRLRIAACQALGALGSAGEESLSLLDQVGKSGWDVREPSRSLMEVGLFLGSKNLGRAARNAARKIRAAAKLDPVEVSPERVDPAREGKPTVLSGLLEGEVRDAEFGVATKGLSLVRVTEVYRWIPRGKGYTKAWTAEVPERLPSKRRVDPRFVLRSKTHHATSMTLGVFAIDPAFGNGYDAREPKWISLQGLETKSRARTACGRTFVRNGDAYYPEGQVAKKPRLGDVRIRFQVQRKEFATLFGRQVGKRLVTLRALK